MSDVSLEFVESQKKDLLYMIMLRDDSQKV